MVRIGNEAWFALMNWRTRTGSCRSPARTKPPPLPGCRAPGAIAGSRDVGEPVPPSRNCSGRHCGDRYRNRLEPPSCGSPGRMARTRERGRLGRVQSGPARPYAAGIPTDKGGGFSAAVNTSCASQMVSTESGQLHIAARFLFHSATVASTARSALMNGRCSFSEKKKLVGI